MSLLVLKDQSFLNRQRLCCGIFCTEFTCGGEDRWIFGRRGLLVEVLLSQLQGAIGGINLGYVASLLQG